MNSLPLISESGRRYSVGSGCMLILDDIYLVTARHNVTTHKARYTAFGQTESNSKGDKWTTIHLIDPGEVPIGGGAKPIDTISIESIELDTAQIYHDSNWDIAIIELPGFEPNSHGLDIFSKILTPETGQNVEISGYYSMGGKSLDDIIPQSITGTITEPLDQLNFGEERVSISELSDLPISGMSGAPVHDESGLYGIHNMHYQLNQKEVESLSRDYEYAIFNRASVLENFV